jgi:iron complex transport system ATP-binding protein
MGARRIVDGIDLTVGHGDWLTIVGPNGAGKTTLLRALAGLIPSTGRVELSGSQLSSLSARERARPHRTRTASAALACGDDRRPLCVARRTAHLTPLGREGAHDYDIVERALDTARLTRSGRSTVGHSVGWGTPNARSLPAGCAQQARVLFLDEPTSALDIGHQQDLLDLIDNLRHELE